MKRVYSISLAVFYLTLSIGVMKSTHYCMGRIFDVNYFSASEESCMPGMEDMHCCSNELELIKIEEDQNQSFFNLNEKQLIELQTLPVKIELLALSIHKEEVNFVNNYDLPPPLEVPIYKLNCTYTYYG